MAGVAARAMTGVEAEQEFDFDFLFEFKHSDEGGGGSRRGGRGTCGGAGGGMLRGAVLAVPRSGGGKAASPRGERGGGAGNPGRTGRPGPGRCLSPQPRREAASGINPARAAGALAGPWQQPNEVQGETTREAAGAEFLEVWSCLRFADPCVGRSHGFPPSLWVLPVTEMGRLKTHFSPLSPSPREPELGSGFNLKVICK